MWKRSFADDHARSCVSSFFYKPRRCFEDVPARSRLILFALATGNPHKLEEFSRALGEKIVPPSRYGLTMDVEETGVTFEENALIKARWLAGKSGAASLADDSGLAVDALDGAPGVYSARFGGEGLDDGGRRLLLLEKLKDVPPALRTARFVCVLALCNPDGSEYTFRGECEGSILFEERRQAVLDTIRFFSIRRPV